MHTFQPITPAELEASVFQMIGSDWMLVTAENEGKVNTMTASWGGLGVLWSKNVAFVFIRESRYTKEFIDNTDTFSLSFFNGSHRMELKYLGAVSGRNEDKIHNCRLTVAHHDETPYFDEANTVLICRKMAAQPISKEFFLDSGIDSSFYKSGDYHVMYIAEIKDIMAR